MASWCFFTVLWKLVLEVVQFKVSQTRVDWESAAAPGSKSLIQHIFEDVILYMIHYDSSGFYVSSYFIPFHGGV